MSCHRCKSTTCPGCVTEVDCITCDQPVSIDHTDSKGRCPACAAGVAAALEGEREEIVEALVKHALSGLGGPDYSRGAAMAAEIVRARGKVVLP